MFLGVMTVLGALRCLVGALAGEANQVVLISLDLSSSGVGGLSLRLEDHRVGLILS
jgi:hypothetical protein